jgi:hypothetical protein
VEAWSQPAVPLGARSSHAPALTIDATNNGLAHASTENESEAAHRAAGAYAQQLLDRYGRATVLDWLRSGIPAGIVATLRQR